MFKLRESVKEGVYRRRMTQRSFAAKMGFTEVYVSHLCNNIDSSTSTRTAQKMADIFRVKLSEFISWGEQNHEQRVNGESL